MGTHTATSGNDAGAGRQALALVGFDAGSAVAGLVGDLASGAAVGARYLALDRPTWAPPQEAFGIVWP